MTKIAQITAPEAVAGAGPRAQNRRRLLMIAGPLVLALGVGVWWLMGGRYESTDDAYLHQARINVAASVGGRVTRVNVSDNQAVKEGAVLFEVDQVPYQIALAQADTAVSSARLGVEQLKVAYGQAQAQARLAADDAAYLTAERVRQEALEAKGAATGNKLNDARYEERRALDQSALAEQSVAGALAALGGNPTIAADSHPAVQAALAVRRQAAYNLANATVTAAADGIVYQAASFRTGQMVAVGQPLFTLIETKDIWVEANFKETQLSGIEVGQPATVTFDADPGHPVQAVVDAVGAGTGAEFSLLPAQNATGNWVKVTQRVPVRLRLTEPVLGKLASGLSASVSVDTGRHRGLASLLPSIFGGK